MSALYLLLVFSLPCLPSGHGQCYDTKQQAQQERAASEKFVVLCTQTKCTAQKEPTEQQTQNTCTRFPCVIWSWVGSYVRLIGDDPVALFTAFLFFSTALLWWVTERTLGHTEASSERQLRAYISAMSADTRYVEGAFVARVIIKNCGATPAHKITVKSTASFSEGRVTREYDPTQTRGETFVLGPGCEQYIDIIPGSLLTPENRREHFEEKKRRFVAYGDVDYVDAFGKAHLTRFQYVLPRNILKGGPISPDLEGNDAT